MITLILLSGNPANAMQLAQSAVILATSKLSLRHTQSSSALAWVYNCPFGSWMPSSQFQLLVVELSAASSDIEFETGGIVIEVMREVVVVVVVEVERVDAASVFLEDAFSTVGVMRVRVESGRRSRSLSVVAAASTGKDVGAATMIEKLLFPNLSTTSVDLTPTVAWKGPPA